MISYDQGKRWGYTLIEALIVIGIIVVLAGFLSSGLIKARQKAKMAQARVLLDSIAAALRMYQDDFGAYPPIGATIYGGYTCLAPQYGLYYYLGATFNAGANASIVAGPYLRFKGDEIQTLSASACSFDGEVAINDDMMTIIDPWGNAIRYQNPPVKNQNTYDLYSTGPNGINENGVGDDINNWE